MESRRDRGSRSSDQPYQSSLNYEQWRQWQYAQGHQPQQHHPPQHYPAQHYPPQRHNQQCHDQQYHPPQRHAQQFTRRDPSSQPISPYHPSQVSLIALTRPPMRTDNGVNHFPRSSYEEHHGSQDPNSASNQTYGYISHPEDPYLHPAQDTYRASQVPIGPSDQAHGYNYYPTVLPQYSSEEGHRTSQRPIESPNHGYGAASHGFGSQPVLYSVPRHTVDSQTVVPSRFADVPPESKPTNPAPKQSEFEVITTYYEAPKRARGRPPRKTLNPSTRPPPTTTVADEQRSTSDIQPADTNMIGSPATARKRGTSERGESHTGRKKVKRIEGESDPADEIEWARSQIAALKRMLGEKERQIASLTSKPKNAISGAPQSEVREKKSKRASEAESAVAQKKKVELEKQNAEEELENTLTHVDNAGITRDWAFKDRNDELRKLYPRWMTQLKQFREIGLPSSFRQPDINPLPSARQDCGEPVSAMRPTHMVEFEAEYATEHEEAIRNDETDGTTGRTPLRETSK